MTFSSRKAAAALVGAGFVYMVAALATGRSARAEIPPDLSAKASDAALDVWKAAAAIVEADGKAAVVDVRPEDAFARYHLPGATSAPGASADDVAALAKTRPVVIVYAGKDEVARKLVVDARAKTPGARIHYLADGARAWYLALSLPVPLFSETGAPDGYSQALAAVNGWLERPDPAKRAETVAALQTLARLNYQPTLLKSGGKPKAGGGGKKIAGGCG